MQNQRTTQTRTAEVSGQRNPATSNAQLPTPASVNPILQLQQTLGNQAVQRLLESRAIQARLKVSRPDDIYEQEADRVAEPGVENPNDTEDGLIRRKSRSSVERNGGTIESVLNSAQGGQPLEPYLRSDMEQRIGADFS